MGNEKFEILRLLIENQERKFSIREIAKIRKVNYKSAYLAIKKLEEEGVVSSIRGGNTLNCSFNKNFNSLVFDVEYFRREEILKKKNFRIIYDSLKNFGFPLICLLFGSFVDNTVSKNSDIDLIFICENKKEIERAINLIPLNIHLSIFSYGEFESMLKSREFSVFSEAIKKNIILWGIEDYYKFLEVRLNVEQ